MQNTFLFTLSQNPSLYGLSPGLANVQYSTTTLVGQVNEKEKCKGYEREEKRHVLTCLRQEREFDCKKESVLSGREGQSAG